MNLTLFLFNRIYVNTCKMDCRQHVIEKNLRLRARIIAGVRTFFNDNGYLEIDTPCRIPSPAPEAHVNALPSDTWFLQTSPELCMKRLVAAGYHRIYQICKCFRQHERGAKHLPELTMLEWYTAGDNYFDMMDQCEKLIRRVAGFTKKQDALGQPVLSPSIYRGVPLDITGPWPKMRVAEAFERFYSLSMDAVLNSDRFDEVMALHIEPNLGWGKPVFLYDYPATFGALARLKSDDSTVAERFELYIHGLELCNGFSELTDPGEQRLRFKKENRIREEKGSSRYPMPEKFLESLASMPESAGNALGIDRLIMVFADLDKIDDGVAFIPEEL